MPLVGILLILVLAIVTVASAKVVVQSSAPLPTGNFSLEIRAPLLGHAAAAKLVLQDNNDNELWVRLCLSDGYPTLECVGYRGQEDTSRRQSHELTSNRPSLPLTSLTLDFTVSSNGTISVTSPEAMDLKPGTCYATLQGPSTITADWRYDDKSGTANATLTIGSRTSPIRFATPTRETYVKRTLVNVTQVPEDAAAKDGHVALY
ncbi:hypothetical protein RI367_006963 [Sorochytrium milnesiophthora]